VRNVALSRPSFFFRFMIFPPSIPGERDMRNPAPPEDRSP
jgi:hypothetical protein